MHSSRHAFTLIDAIITLALFAIVSSFVVPEYYNYFLRNDLNLAEETVIQFLKSAQIRAQSGEQGDAWGVYIPTKHMFRGENFFDRDPVYDEPFYISSSIIVSGLNEVWFSPLYGLPNETGSIILTALNGETREIAITEYGLLDAASEPEEESPSAPDVVISIAFERIENRYGGSAENATFVGPDAIRFEEGAPIPLTANGVPIIDNGLTIGTSGLAIQRQPSFIRVLAYGGLPFWSKEIVDARITFQHASIDHAQNDTGTYEMEWPFDGYVSDSTYGDEVSISPDNQSALVQSRVNWAGDSILIYWTK